MDKRQKIERLVLQAYRAYERTREPYIKIPVEMAEFALRERQVMPVSVYLAFQFAYPGKAAISGQVIQEIASKCAIGKSSVYSAFEWLIKNDWIRKHTGGGYYFASSINFIHNKEGWKFKSSALMREHDLKPKRKLKAFFIGAFLSNVCKWGNMGKRSERIKRRSVQPFHPVSLSFISNALNVDISTAFKYRKLAEKYKYIKMYQNLEPVPGLNADTVKLMRAHEFEEANKLVINNGEVFVQRPNLIEPFIIINKRRINRYQLSLVVVR